jgi:hypothetical protein
MITWPALFGHQWDEIRAITSSCRRTMSAGAESSRGSSNRPSASRQKGQTYPGGAWDLKLEGMAGLLVDGRRQHRHHRHDHRRNIAILTSTQKAGNVR